MCKEWKILEKYKGYEISNVGEVKNTNTNKILKPSVSTKGYNTVMLKGKRVYVHRLVATLFIPNADNKQQVNHINGIKTDNRVENLEWVTCSENIIHSYKIGKQRMGWDRELINKNAKSHFKKIKNLELDKIYISVTEASKDVGICISHISNCLHGRIQTAGGYHWEFVNEVLI